MRAATGRDPLDAEQRSVLVRWILCRRPGRFREGSLADASNSILAKIAYFTPGPPPADWADDGS
jgi:hypothetical protein